MPPERISILTESGHHIPNYILGPFNEGDTVEVRCEATGGRPSPRVSWWLENALVDDVFDRVSDRTVTNVLRLDRLTRHELGHVYTCQASNNHLAAPISSSVTINLNCKSMYRYAWDEFEYKTRSNCVGLEDRFRPRRVMIPCTYHHKCSECLNAMNMHEMPVIVLINIMWNCLSRIFRTPIPLPSWASQGLCLPFSFRGIFPLTVPDFVIQYPDYSPNAIIFLCIMLRRRKKLLWTKSLKKTLSCFVCGS